MYPWCDLVVASGDDGDTGDGVSGVSPVAALIVLATIRCGVGAAISSAARPQCVRERLKLYILWR